jgi:hypothetical protein
MLITFSTPAYPKITMFGDIAVKLLKLMGHSGKIPGALSAGDVPAALQKLRAGVQAQAATEPETAENDDPAAEPRVGLATRAFPLIELLEAAAAAEKEVMWDQ